MSNLKVIKTLKQYQKASVKARKEYMGKFEQKMIYRTTKTENPEVTSRMVRQTLSKMK